MNKQETKEKIGAFKKYVWIGVYETLLMTAIWVTVFLLGYAIGKLF